MIRELESLWKVRMRRVVVVVRSWFVALWSWVVYMTLFLRCFMAGVAVVLAGGVFMPAQVAACVAYRGRRERRMLTVDRTELGARYEVRFLARGVLAKGWGTWVEQYIPNGCQAAPIEKTLAAIIEHAFLQFAGHVWISSGYRLPATNGPAGGKPQSPHTCGFGCDLGFRGVDRDQIWDFFESLGVPGLIEHSWGIHVDTYPRKYHVRLPKSIEAERA